MTTPDLLKRWLGVHDGWSLVVCEIDLKVDGAFRYVWRGPESGVAAGYDKLAELLASMLAQGGSGE